jgi:hypothetical protein
MPLHKEVDALFMEKEFTETYGRPRYQGGVVEKTGVFPFENAFDIDHGWLLIEYS